MPSDADPGRVPVPRPFDEAERLAALYRARVLGSEPESEFDDLVQLAAQLTGMPIAALNLVDDDEQTAKASVGLPREALRLPRDQAACSWTVLGREPLEVSLQTDPRTRDVPVWRRFGLQAYAAAPVLDRDGRALGALCVLDTKEHPLTQEQLDDLSALARQAAVLLEWRLARVPLQERLSRRADRQA